MEQKFQTQKIILDGNWYEELINSINENNSRAEILPEESKKVILDRNQRILDKLDKYKKKDENDNVFYYFYIRELRDLFWILLEDYSSIK